MGQDYAGPLGGELIWISREGLRLESPKTTTVAATSRARKNERKVGLVLLFTGLALLGITYKLGNLQRALDNWSLAQASVEWPTVEGELGAAWVETKRGSRSSSTSVYHTPKVSYTYSIDGQSYKGTRLRFAHIVLGNRAGGSKARALVEPYKGQDTVPVHYNPDQPQQSVLEPGLPDYGSYRDLVNLALWGLLSLAVMGAGLWLALPPRRKTTQ